ncbi:MAG: glycosyltransferase family 4 protein [Bacteroidota bacterium]
MNNKAELSNRLIGFVSNSAWYIYIHRWDSIQFLLNQGYKILIVAPPDQPIPAFNLPQITYIPLQFSNKSRSVADGLKLYLSLTKLYKLYKPACLFHFAIKANTFGNFAAKRAGIPCISVIIGTGYPFMKPGFLFQVSALLYRLSLPISIETWFMNEEDAALFTRHKLVSPKKLIVMHGEGIDTQIYNPVNYDVKEEAAVFTFITATRLLYSKGIATLAEAIGILREKGFAFRSLLVGAPDSDHPDSIPPSLIANWQIRAIFEVIPFTTDVRPWLAKADCFVLPSFYNEGLPRCLMEAASMQLPVITTSQQGCKDAIVNGATGLFARTGDAADLALQMQAMLQMDPAIRKEMGCAGRIYMKKEFSQENIFAHYLRIVQKFVSE